ncbi:hypothetical protein H2200_003465 [Cladophialophora chaetospira]|uniref:Fungal N-terminal domain-containing protein n=1 Tax=Cladophialophora chaetospira TaxID=386627 RepID=A0AA38XHE3_9EURO|nr:hypothetical protein H2200_003465 [Cladophialophora chaetospira]
MSGLEILGLAASVIQIADLGAKLSVKLFTFSRKVKNADKSIDSISQDIAATGAVLAQLGAELNKEENVRLRSPAAITTTKSLVESCEKLFGELNEAIDGGGGGGNGSGHTLILELRRRLRFPFLEPQIELLRCNLERLKTSLLVILNVLILAEQLRSHKTGEILKDQHELLRTLVKEKDTSERNFKRILQTVEAAKDPETPTASSNPGESVHHDATSSLSTTSDAVTTTSNPLAGAATVAIKLPVAIKNHIQLNDHCLLISKMLTEIGVLKYRIDYGQRDRVQKAVLKVHWDEWAQLRRKHGEKPLLELFAALRQDELLQYWKQMAEAQEESVAEQSAPLDGAEHPHPENQSFPPEGVQARSQSHIYPQPRSHAASAATTEDSEPKQNYQSRDSSDGRALSEAIERNRRLPETYSRSHLQLSRVSYEQTDSEREQDIDLDDSDQTIRILLSGLANEAEIARLQPDVIVPKALNLEFPTEASPLGFCKGAIRLLSADEKDRNHAFSVISRPSSMYHTVRVWKCRSCAFEGPVARPSGGNETKKTKQESFDSTIYTNNRSVRYKWAFLARSHLPMKAPSGSAIFACLFCCVEGGERGWSSDGTSGTLEVFMEHLAGVHREESVWPSVEMQTRLQCIVGRVAKTDEDWDVNLLPLEVGDESINTLDAPEQKV